MKYIDTEKIVIKSWCEVPEDGAIEQAKNLAKLPFAYKQIALMPDTHQGYGMPIGGVLATKDVVVPNAVGVDIGCGMCFVETNIPVDAIKDIDTPNGNLIKAIMGNIRKAVPVGFDKHKEKQESPLFNVAPTIDVIVEELDNAMYSLGTLGGGNHFIELQKNEKGNLCLMLHSGSRNFGKKIADVYNKKAKELNAKNFSSVPKEWDLAFLPVDSPEGREYIEAMNYALLFASENRRIMKERILNIIFNMVEKYANIIGIKIISSANIHHNYANLENHFGENVWVHRKGATSAKEGEIGIIPGSQGTSSYIVEGLGNKESFMSCSHGAGRKMGRNQARKNLVLADEIKKLEDKGVIHAIRSEEDLDEASGAYKDIDVVMEEQKDLVKILHKLEPVAVIKG
jgi:tRNA-splicing ligase RtcB